MPDLKKGSSPFLPDVEIKESIVANPVQFNDEFHFINGMQKYKRISSIF